MSRITVSYSDEEDRIELACQYETGGVQVLWLTRRLCDRLVEALVMRLEKTERQDPFSADTLQSWELSAARAALLPENPVSGSGASRMLVNSIDIGRENGKFRLFFRWNEGGALLILDDTSLRQWLSFVHDAYVRAQWESGVWPAWFASSSTNHRPSSGMSLH